MDALLTQYLSEQLKTISLKHPDLRPHLWTLEKGVFSLVSSNTNSQDLATPQTPTLPSVQSAKWNHKASTDKFPYHSVIPLLYAEELVGLYEIYSKAAIEDTQKISINNWAQQWAPLWMNNHCFSVEMDKKIQRLHESNENYSWTGIYLLDQTTLKLATYRGAPTPHSIIPQSKGICGAAVSENKTLYIENVKEDPRYLSCDIRTRSEVVIPIRDKMNKPIGEIDIDSHRERAFQASDITQLEQLANELSVMMLQ